MKSKAVLIPPQWLCVTFVSVSQVNTGLIQIKAAQETPSKCSATSPQVEKHAFTQIRSLQG